MPERGFESFNNTGENAESIDRATARERGDKVNEVVMDEKRRKIEEFRKAHPEEFKRMVEAEMARRGLKVAKAAAESVGAGAGSAERSAETGGSEAGGAKSSASEAIDNAINAMDSIARGEGVADGGEIEEEVDEEFEEETEGGAEEGASEGERAPSPEAVRKTLEKSKKNQKWKKYLLGVGAAALVFAGVALATSISGQQGESVEELAPTPAPTTMAETMNDREGGEMEMGIHDGYDAGGMWLSEDKSSPYAFADAGEVAEICNNDETEMIKYTAHNQVESFADYMANLPEALQPEGFKGLNLAETEARLESLSPEDYTELEVAFGGIMDNAFTRRVTLNGAYDNAYMALKDPSGAVTHENMQLVRCATNESNLEVTQFYWVDADGNEIGTMTVKMSPVYDADGNIVSYKLCEQVVNPQGLPIYEGVPEVPSDPVPDSPSTPTPNTPTPSTPTPETPTPETPAPETPAPETPAPETPTPETPAPETPTPETPTPETPTPETPAPKDADNLKRIDEDINNQIEYDYGTNEVVVHQETAAPEDRTERPAPEAYQGTGPTIVESEAAREAEPVQDYISSANDYSQNRGGTNATEYAPVQENQAAQAAADAAEIPVEQAPTGGQELADILGDLGIN